MLSKVHIACLSREHNEKYSLQAVNQNFKGIIGILAAVTSDNTLVNLYGSKNLKIQKLSS